MDLLQYPVRLTADRSGFVVTCRDLPALITQGDDEAQALREAADAMDEVIATYLKQDLELPAPSKARRGEYLVSAYGFSVITQTPSAGARHVPPAR